MKRTKNKKYELKSEETEKKKKSQSSEEKVEPVVSFDAYFRRLLSEQKAQPHHKAPMKAYAKKREMLNGTLKEFDKIFSSY